MRISDWSSDVCSSDLVAEAVFDVLRHLRRYRQYAESGTGPAARRLAILGLASVFDKSVLNTGLSEIEQQWLAHVQGISIESLSRAVRDSLPDRSEERRVGKECVSTCRSRWSQ